LGHSREIFKQLKPNEKKEILGTPTSGVAKRCGGAYNLARRGGNAAPSQPTTETFWSYDP